MDTIFALSSGSPPAGIAVIRISGPGAGAALLALAGSLPTPRRATLADFTDEEARWLDRGLMLWFPAPASVTGEDLAELHLHGGRAVVAAVEGALSRRAGMRRAEPGEFTRRAFAHGRIDLAEAEGLADLLQAETELQRAVAANAAGGRMSREVESWRERVLALSAHVEATLDFADEDDVGALPAGFESALADLVESLAGALAVPPAERLREGVRVALAGPPNAGKSTLFNTLVDAEAAIATPYPGTTRDVLERPIALDGVPLVMIDMAGLRSDSGDPVEAIGIVRAEAAMAGADIVLWLGPPAERPSGAWQLDTKIDLPGHVAKADTCYAVSAVSGEGIANLRAGLANAARQLLPKPEQSALQARQRSLVHDAHSALLQVEGSGDALVIAEHLRQARRAFDRFLGRSGIEEVLDALFGRFCIGK